jgi:hypothetical protein
MLIERGLPGLAASYVGVVVSGTAPPRVIGAGFSPAGVALQPGHDLGPEGGLLRRIVEVHEA